MSGRSLDGPGPLAPCAAYRHVASRLPGSYFVEPPPIFGVAVVVVDVSDGVRSTWRMSEFQANEIVPSLRSLRGVTVRVEPYTDRGKP